MRTTLYKYNKSSPASMERFVLFPLENHYFINKRVTPNPYVIANGSTWGVSPDDEKTDDRKNLHN